MYIINTKFKPTKNGGIYYCTIYDIFTNRRYELQNRDVTKAMSDKLGLTYKKGMIEISHGSGTGAMVLRDLLMQYTGIGFDKIVDVSF